MDDLPTLHVNYNPDKLGFYQVGTYKTHRKLLAINEHRRTSAGIKWIFNEDRFLRYDWTRCPSLSLEDLYQRRAESLRNQYDRIVLFYSGGSDSQIVLDTFIKSDLPIDMIICGHSTQGDRHDLGYFSEEITRVARPYLDSIKHKIPWTKIYYVDHTQAILDSFKDRDWYIDHNNMLTPNCVVRSRMREWFRPLHDLIATGEKVAIVCGRDKPYILKDELGYFIQFDDHNDNNTSPYSQSRAYLGWYDEFFYHDPTCADIVCRQAHEILARLEEKSIDPIYFTDDFTKFGRCPHTGKYLTQLGVTTVIYPQWPINTFSNGKNLSMVWGARDQWFFETAQHTPAYRAWKNAIDYLNNILRHSDSNHDWVIGDDRIVNIKGCLSPKYRLT
jgi:hypothetical protein